MIFLMNKTEKIWGKKVSLRPATLADRQPIFDWLTKSGLTQLIIVFHSPKNFIKQDND